MNLDQLRGEVRELCGGPATNEVANRQIDRHILAATEYMAAELGYRVVTSSYVIAYVADQVEYPLPKDFARCIFVESNSLRLTPTSTFKLEKDGVDWRHGASGTPQNYGFTGRSIFFQPAPSSDYITDTPSPVIRYIASQSELGADGVADLSELDEQVVIYKAAIRYLRSHPSDENQARIMGYKEELAELIRSARQRALNPDETFNPNWFVNVDRQGAAR
jgi:hypothetical protein